jgi:DNA helicase-2/ATP-dependent DNA helicase PcrA
MSINETRVFGPPGTGKTTYTSKQITHAANQFGAENILVASFTRAAAKELISRDQVIADDQIGTLHAHCYRLLGKPELAEVKAKEFNEEYPHLSITPSGNIKLDDGLTGPDGDEESNPGGGDELLAQMSIYRARMVPKDLWLPGVLDFARAWEDFKEKTGYMDFQDLIERAGDEYYPPKHATIGVFDEVQDFTPSQLRLIRRWAKQMHWIMLAGDDDQCLYSFTGATPEAFLNPPVPDENKRILRQSYRVPAKVMRLANTIVRKLSLREPKEYRPREEEGKIYGSDATWKKPNELLPTIKGYLREEKSVMVLATCSYILAPTIRMFREHGIPFSNIYKATRGDWNPIRAKQTGNAGSFGRYCAFLEPAGPEFQGRRLWTPHQLAAWVDVIKAQGNFKRGAKKAIKELVERKTVRAEDILRFLTDTMEESAFNAAIALDHYWFLENLTSAKVASFEFPAKIYNAYGPEAPEVARQLTVGTIHSVKGAEADVVILFPDLSMRGAQQYSTRNGEGFDQILRQFYVGVTRARHTLILCRGVSNGMFFNDYA